MPAEVATLHGEVAEAASKVAQATPVAVVISVAVNRHAAVADKSVAGMLVVALTEVNSVSSLNLQFAIPLPPAPVEYSH